MYGEQTRAALIGEEENEGAEGPVLIFQGGDHVICITDDAPLSRHIAPVENAHSREREREKVAAQCSANCMA